MKTVGTTIAEAVLLLVVAAVVGLGVNAARGRDSIKLLNDYFTIKVTPPSPPETNEPNEPNDPNDPNAMGLGFQALSHEEVVKIWEDPKYRHQLYVIVDARNDHAYESGHIPGAVQCDYYRFEDFTAEVIPAVMGAEKVVVYCHGGDCEDSLLVCGKLIEYQIPWHCIFVYKEGWEDWVARGMPIAEGRE